MRHQTRNASLFQGLLESFGLALGLWVCGGAVFLGDAEVLEFCLEAGAAAAAAAPGEPDGVDHAVVGQLRSWRAVGRYCGPERGQHDSCGDPVVGGADDA